MWNPDPDNIPYMWRPSPDQLSDENPLDDAFPLLTQLTEAYDEETDSYPGNAIAPRLFEYEQCYEVQFSRSPVSVLSWVMGFADGATSKHEALAHKAAESLMSQLDIPKSKASQIAVGNGCIKYGNTVLILSAKETSAEERKSLIEYKDFLINQLMFNSAIVYVSFDDEFELPSWQDFTITRKDMIDAFSEWENYHRDEKTTEILKQLFTLEDSFNSWKHLPIERWNKNAWDGFFLSARTSGLLSFSGDSDFHSPDLALATERKQDFNSLIASIYDADCHDGHTLWLRRSIDAIDLEIRQGEIVVCVYLGPKEALR